MCIVGNVAPNLFEGENMLDLATIERHAYMANDQKTLALLAMAEDCQSDAIDDAVEQAREAAYSEGYAEGKRDALDVDAQEKIEDAESKADSYKRQLDACKDALKRIELELVGDGAKTITGRKSMAKALQRLRYAHGLF